MTSSLHCCNYLLHQLHVAVALVEHRNTISVFRGRSRHSAIDPKLGICRPKAKEQKVGCLQNQLKDQRATSPELCFANKGAYRRRGRNDQEGSIGVLVWKLAVLFSQRRKKQASLNFKSSLSELT